MTQPDIIFLDCTLRDGGYYNHWDFSTVLINDYLKAIAAIGVDVAEIGFRFVKNDGFKGACAYSTDTFIRSLDIPSGLAIGVMVNATELLLNGAVQYEVLQRLFPERADTSPVKLVRIACHAEDFVTALPVSQWLHDAGYDVGFNIMQISELMQAEVEALGREASQWPITALFFADSFGGLQPTDIRNIIGWLRLHWIHAIGIHAHDNMGLALQNSLCALDEGAIWMDATVTGMGRGPGNTKTEHLAIEIAQRRNKTCNLIPLLSVIKHYFEPMKRHYAWGTNPYYYLAGKYGIHPTYVQEMLQDSRYSETDLISVIQRFESGGGKKFNANALDMARHFYDGEPRGTWDPSSIITAREVLILGSGPGVANHAAALENYIVKAKPFVMALNAQVKINPALIDVHVACHPVRLLADSTIHAALPQPLIVPASMLPEYVKEALLGKRFLDFGIEVKNDTFAFSSTHCVVPTALTIAYALAIATAGKAKAILLAGFDGYGADDPRSVEMDKLLQDYYCHESALSVCAITPSRYQLAKRSIYGL